MGSWYYLWENGDVSFVSAESKDEAVDLLDEVGEAEPERLKPIKGGFFFGMTLKKGHPEKGEFPWDDDGVHSESALSVLHCVEDEARKRSEEMEKELAADELQKKTE